MRVLKEILILRPAKPDVVLHHHAIDETLYDKLENTAEKLAKLNAVNDLKLLQVRFLVIFATTFNFLTESYRECSNGDYVEISQYFITLITY